MPRTSPRIVNSRTDAAGTEIGSAVAAMKPEVERTPDLLSTLLRERQGPLIKLGPQQAQASTYKGRKGLNSVQRRRLPRPLLSRERGGALARTAGEGEQKRRAFRPSCFACPRVSNGEFVVRRSNARASRESGR